MRYVPSSRLPSLVPSVKIPVISINSLFSSSRKSSKTKSSDDDDIDFVDDVIGYNDDVNGCNDDVIGCTDDVTQCEDDVISRIRSSQAALIPGLNFANRDKRRLYLNAYF